VTRSPDSGDGHRAVSKNGRDGAQDRAIADNEGRNRSEHAAIIDLINDLKLSVSLDVERVTGAVRAHRLIALVVWAILAITITATGRMVDHGIDFLEKMSADVADIDKRQAAWEPLATERDDGLARANGDLKEKHRRDLDRVRGDIKELRRAPRPRE
jgi:hypothetical protein